MEISKDKIKYLVMGILVVLILFVLRSLITSGNDTVVDYNKTPTGYEMALSGEVIKDREIYFIINSILDKLISAYEDASIEVKIEDYYDALNKSYKNKISKNKYLELIDKLINNITIIDNDVYGEFETLQRIDIIRAIYKLDKDTYLCAVGLREGTTIGYLGVQLDTDKNTFEIFYIE